MTDDTHTDGTGTLTRRRVLAGAVAGATGVGTLTAVTRDASAQADVTLGELSATGDEATLSSAPAAIDVTATGEWGVETAGGVEQVMITLQATVDGQTDDLTTERVFDGTSGTFDLAADVIADHRDVSGEAFVPGAAGETAETDVDLAVVVSAVQDGSVAAEARVSDTATVTVTQAGVQVEVGGTATVSVES